MPADPVSEIEILAYVDGELDLGRRLAVEQHLAACPRAAARVMADLGAQTALRLAQPAFDPREAGLADAAARLSAMLARPPRAPMPFFSRRRAGVAAVTVAGLATVVAFVPKGATASPPAYVSSAVMAFQTGLIRAGMHSQRADATFDPADVQRSTNIRVPTLPDGWQVTDVQLIPSDEGPALQIMVHTSDARVVSIFAVRSSVTAPAKPIATRYGGASVAYWRHGEMAYALTGLDAPDALDLAAEDLADNRLS
ncbi:zf-HC2 domain-containing protein [Sphingomonas naphthae]|uniref:Zf-HC2 domain-containing protein n=1 Tax=Sphingomonas naphthae TaxID=1813468 RepID=A0ABY7TGB4_9SPHN|nr:zf-HC2 domain-containing protein [Sphingomonas naphthae]WCT71873.1 zf-HC2 domain-containing protein [Sphingomonas naphthae]